MLRMIFITLAVFALTVTIGIGVGLGLLKVTENNSTDVETPAVVTTPSPEPTNEPTPEPTPEAFDTSTVEILVVNATTKAGYAGTVKNDLDDAEFGSVSAANASGEYEEGNYLLVTEDVSGLADAVEDATGLSVEVIESEEEYQVEDVSGAYTAVLVLAE